MKSSYSLLPRSQRNLLTRNLHHDNIPSHGNEVTCQSSSALCAEKISIISALPRSATASIRRKISLMPAQELRVARCLNPKCNTPLPGQPLMMNSLELREVRTPEAGDIGICAACGRIMLFLGPGFGYQVRDPSPEEAKLIGNNREVMEIREAIINRLVKEPPKAR